MWFFIYKKPDSFEALYAAKNLIFVCTKVVFHSYKSPSLRMYSWFVLLNYDSFHFFISSISSRGFFYPTFFSLTVCLTTIFPFFYFRFVNKIFNFWVDLTYFLQRNFISTKYSSFLTLFFALFVHQYLFAFDLWNWWEGSKKFILHNLFKNATWYHNPQM